MAPKKREENMITFYGSWRQGTDNYNILLEYADQGTLIDFFETTEPPTEENDRLRFWSALLDVVKALQRIHEIEQSWGGQGVLQGWVTSSLAVQGGMTDAPQNPPRCEALKYSCMQQERELSQ